MTTTKMTTRLKCVDCKLVDCERKDKCFDSLVERKFLIPISEADDERSHGTLLFKWFLMKKVEVMVLSDMVT